MDEKIYIQNLIQLLAEKCEIPLDESEAFVKAVFDLIEEGLETDRIVKIKGLGTFKLIGVGSRESINVNTGERILIGSHTKISFVPDQQMRELINKPFSHFETVLLNEGVTFDDMPVTSMEDEREDAEESTDFIAEQTDRNPATQAAPADANPAEAERIEGGMVATHVDSTDANPVGTESIEGSTVASQTVITDAESDEVGSIESCTSATQAVSADAETAETDRIEGNQEATNTAPADAVLAETESIEGSTSASQAVNADSKSAETESIENNQASTQKETATADELPAEPLQVIDWAPETTNSSEKDEQGETNAPQPQPVSEEAIVAENEDVAPNQPAMNSDENAETVSATAATPGLDEAHRHEPEPEVEKHSRLSRYLGILAAAVLMGVIGGVMVYFHRQNHTLLNMDNVVPVSTTPIAPATEPEEMPDATDSVPAAKDTVLAKPVLPAPKTDTTKTIITGVRRGRESVIADSTSYRIVGTMTTYKLKRGETLTMVSRKFYDTKDLWPYLVMHNRDVIANPNNVPVGTVLRIPALRNK